MIWAKIWSFFMEMVGTPVGSRRSSVPSYHPLPNEQMRIHYENRHHGTVDLRRPRTACDPAGCCGSTLRNILPDAAARTAFNASARFVGQFLLKRRNASVVTAVFSFDRYDPAVIAKLASKAPREKSDKATQEKPDRMRK
ncbi:hypothetical protein JQ628_01755 [Bradyrhizobium lablabi]|uniref:hypothetical protein n=1 Tax=Bradyrhizobium lablabi TaxID=722472 RepID=UPI001BA78FCB|nr:hypothetical protein [Bradyrhizobium lablabi]MBR1120222.1 hypothetical protein [Bradyrhizobium lablabi]